MPKWTCNVCDYERNFPEQERCGNCKSLKPHAAISKTTGGDYNAKIFVGGLAAKTTSKQVVWAFQVAGFEVVGFPKVKSGIGAKFCPQVHLKTCEQAERAVAMRTIRIDGRAVDIRPYEPYKNKKKKFIFTSKYKASAHAVVSSVDKRRLRGACTPSLSSSPISESIISSTNLSENRTDVISPISSQYVSAIPALKFEDAGSISSKCISSVPSTKLEQNRLDINSVNKQVHDFLNDAMNKIMKQSEYDRTEIARLRQELQNERNIGSVLRRDLTTVKLSEFQLKEQVESLTKENCQMQGEKLTGLSLKDLRELSKKLTKAQALVDCAKADVASMEQVCRICEDREKSVVIKCGHRYCEQCAHHIGGICAFCQFAFQPSEIIPYYS